VPSEPVDTASPAPPSMMTVIDDGLYWCSKVLQSANERIRNASRIFAGVRHVYLPSRAQTSNDTHLDQLMLMLCTSLQMHNPGRSRRKAATTTEEGFAQGTR
jgi:hypothetical protein